MSIEGIALVLRNLRSRLDLDQAVASANARPHRLSPEVECVADLDAYDQALVSAAAMVGVALPSAPEGERRFTTEQRAQVESGLADAGVELWTEDLEHPEEVTVGEPARTSAGGAAEELRRLLGAPEPADCPADTPPGPSLPQPEVGSSRGRAVWRCEHCHWEGTAWVRPECPRCYTMSTQALRWV